MSIVTNTKQLIKKSTILTSSVRSIRGIINGYRYASQPGERFTCPICEYTGPFVSYSRPDLPEYDIEHTQCPRCELYERHRLQHLAMSDFLYARDFSKKSVLHFAPEPHLAKLLQRNFKIYKSADLYEPGVDLKIDITAMPIPDASYDMVYASHVLEHVIDDDAALREIHRVLKPGGIAVLPVPVVSASTIEYGAPNEFEFGHVRAVGPNYFDRYKRHFKVDVVTSNNYPAEHQLFVHERRDFYPTKEAPLRTPMEGTRHLDYVPICYR